MNAATALRTGVALKSPAISLRDATVQFASDRGVVTALSRISLELDAGSFTTLLGPSGCGKSTLLRLISGLIEPSEGSLTVFGESPARARERREIGFVFQKPALLPWRNVIENVTLPLEVGGRRDSEAADKARQLLGLVGLSGWENARPHELSGGMRQRVSIARALIDNPKILLMDEPFGALDEITRDRLNEELLALWRATGATIVFVTHSIYEAGFLGQEILLLRARPGRIRERIVSDLPHDRSIATRDTAQFGALASRLRRTLETC